MSRPPVLAAAALLVFASLSFFADTIHVQLGGRDPSALPAVETGVPRLSKRVVLAIVDSLAVRIGTNPDIMPNLVALSKRGAAGIMIAPPDTVTTAGVRAMSVGTRPSFRDTLDIFFSKPFGQWTIFDELVSRGEGVGFYGCHCWRDLLGDRALAQKSLSSNENLYSDDDAALAEARTRLLSNDQSAFVVLHIGRTDFFAHQYGTEREEYKRELRKTDAELYRFFNDVSVPGTTFIVTSDHGNDLYGNHGGSGEIYRRVPIILLGAGIRPIHDFVMDGRQMPLALATLLGTRLPGGILEPVPPEFFDLPPAESARLSLANLVRLQRLASFLDVDASGTKNLEQEARRAAETGAFADAIRLSGQAADEIVAAVNVSSRPDPGLLAWILVLGLAMALVYLTAVTSFQFRALVAVLGCAFLVAVYASPSYRLVALALLSALELGLVMYTISCMGSLRQRVGASLALAGIAGIVAVSCLRFALGGQWLFSLINPRGPYGLLALLSPLAMIAAIFLAVVLWFFNARAREVWGSLTGLERGVIPLAVFALTVLQPIEVVPVLIGAVFVLGLRANGTKWLHVAGAATALFIVFLFSQRIGFGWTGERLGVRYLYALATGAVLIGVAFATTGRARSWIVPALLTLLPLWAFGFLKFGHAWDTGTAQTVLFLVAGAAGLAFMWKASILRACAVPLGTAVIYHFHPGDLSFWSSLAVHAVFAVALIFQNAAPENRRTSIAGLMLSLLYLMSPGADFLSVLLLGLCVWFIGRDEAEREASEDASLVLFGALIVTYFRYGILNAFGHVGAGPYSLANLDTHSGFASMTKDVKVWIPASLVVGKMLAASVLAYSMLLISPRYRRRESSIVLASFAVVMAFLVEAAVELALSYGKNETRLSMSIVQVIFHAGILLIMMGGYAGYRFLTLEPKPKPKPKEDSRGRT